MTRPVWDASSACARPLAVCAACGGVAHGTVALAYCVMEMDGSETRTDRDLAFCRHCIAQLAVGLTVDVKVWEEDHL
jgi:hypothetical protein